MAAFRDGRWAAADPSISVPCRGLGLFSPSRHHPFQHEMFLAVQSGEQWTGDERWVRLYGHPVVVSVVNWMAAMTALARRTASADDRSFSTTHSLGDLGVLLERNFVERTLKADLARFWREADSTPVTGGSLHSIENLALAFAVQLAGSFCHFAVSRIEGAPAFVKLSLAIFRRIRLPGETGYEYEPQDMDDLLLLEHWKIAFWTPLVLIGSAIAANTGRKLEYDLAKEFPTAPLLRPVLMVRDVPGPTERAPNVPVPDYLLRSEPAFRCREFLGWLDHSNPGPVGALGRAEVLAWVFPNFIAHGFSLVDFLVMFIREKVAEFGSWLSDEAGLSMLDLLVAEEVLRTSSLPAQLPASYVQAVLGKPLLSEAIRRRSFLLHAMRDVERHLPHDLVSAARDSDHGALAAALTDLAPPLRPHVMAILATLRLIQMLLMCPEPFADVSQDSDGVRNEEAEAELLLFWFSSPSFREASRCAGQISANMRMCAAREGQDAVARDVVFAQMAVSAATHAAWLHLLVLRRFRSLLATEPAGVQASALGLHRDLRADVRACMEIMSLSGGGQAEAVRQLLADLLDAEDARLSRTEVQILKQAQQVASVCEHRSSFRAWDGWCFECAAQRSGSFVASEEASSDLAADAETLAGGDPLAGLAEAVLDALKKRVRFQETLEVWETYHKDEYPARSMRAPDADEDGTEGAAAPPDARDQQRYEQEHSDDSGTDDDDDD